MRKAFQIDNELTDFDDSVLKHTDNTPLTLRKALLHYFTFAHVMGLSPSEEMSLYFIGRKIGKTDVDQPLKLEIQDYNLLKKIVDSGKAVQGNDQKPIYILVVSQQLRVMLDEAETLKEDK